MKFPGWAKKDDAWKKLEVYDRCLEGKQYDDLRYGFYQETNQIGEYIPIFERRPSARFNIARWVSGCVARKLFAGRHRPILKHKNEKVRAALQAIRLQCGLDKHMRTMVVWGSVGAAALSFKIVQSKNIFGEEVSHVVLVPYKAKECFPRFNELGDLARLRVAYVVEGSVYIAQGVRLTATGKKINPTSRCWYIKDIDTESETIYEPLMETEWNPYLETDLKPRDFGDGDENPFNHNLGFVPAQWFCNTENARLPYGSCWWEPALDNSVDHDYTLSSIGMGVRYSACPQLVIKGNLANYDDDGSGSVVRGATRYMQLAADTKDGDFETSNSDVKLLEMNGSGIRVGIESYIRIIKKDALEQICADRIDTDKVTTAMSGKGMEILNDAWFDLIASERTTFGDEGLHKLTKKIGVACVIKKHALFEGIEAKEMDGLDYHWPASNELGPNEFGQLAAGVKNFKEAEFEDMELIETYVRQQIDAVDESANAVPPLVGDRSERDKREPDNGESNKLGADATIPGGVVNL